MASAAQAFAVAIAAGELTHDGNARYARHVANAFKHQIPLRNEKGEPLWTIYKERPDSPGKIDAVVAGIISWQARTDALALGVHEPEVVARFEVVVADGVARSLE